MTAAEQSEQMSPAEVAVAASRTEKTVRAWIASGRLPASKVAGRVVVARADVERLLTAVAVQPAAPRSEA